MLKKIKRFFKLRIIYGWKTRLFHLIFLVILGVFWISNFGTNFNNVTAFFDPNYSFNIPVATRTIVVLLIFCIIQFNVSLILRNWKWDLISLAISLVIMSILTASQNVGSNFNMATFSTTLLVWNTAFTTLVRLAKADGDQKFVKSIFSKYVNPDLLQDILSNPKTLNLDGELKNMTVMFADIRGFTTLAEKLDAKKLVFLLNTYLDSMSEVVLKNDGTIDKYIGDAIMCFWNAPNPDPQHATKAVDTSVDMIQKLYQIAETYPLLKGLNIGIGINTGDMVVGNVGGSKRFEYTVLGDNVNLASRLEGLTKKYGVAILISESTYENYNGGNYQFRILDEIIVKGKTEPVKIYQPLLKNSENQKLKNLYEQAFNLYQKANFNEAKLIFLQLSNLNDHPSIVMYNRISKIESSAFSSWNGIWEWDEK